MTTTDIIQILIFIALIIGFTPLLGNYIFKVFSGSKHFMLAVLGWLEKLCYKFIKVNPKEEGKSHE